MSTILCFGDSITSGEGYNGGLLVPLLCLGVQPGINLLSRVYDKFSVFHDITGKRAAESVINEGQQYCRSAKHQFPQYTISGTLFMLSARIGVCF